MTPRTVERDRFSVALCTRNGGRYVGEQVESILGQVPSPSEIVVSDDDSSDGTLGVISPFKIPTTIVDAKGKIVREAKVGSDPAALVAFL